MKNKNITIKKGAQVMNTIYKNTFNLEYVIQYEMLTLWKEISNIVLSEEQLEELGIKVDYQWNDNEIQLKVRDDKEQIRDFKVKLEVKYE